MVLGRALGCRVSSWLAGVASGVGSAMLLMSFGVSFSVCDLPTIALCTALSIVVSALVFALTLIVSSARCARRRPPLSGICPSLELLCLNKCSADLVDKLEFAVPDHARAHRLLRSAPGCSLGRLRRASGHPTLLRAHRAFAGPASGRGRCGEAPSPSRCSRRACSLAQPSSWPCSRCASRATSPSACSCPSSPYCS